MVNAMQEPGMTSEAKTVAEEAQFWLDQMEQADTLGDSEMQSVAMQEYKARIGALNMLARQKVEKRRQPWFTWPRPVSLRG